MFSSVTFNVFKGIRLCLLSTIMNRTPYKRSISIVLLSECILLNVHKIGNYRVATVHQSFDEISINNCWKSMRC